MSINAYELTVAVLLRGLTNLKRLLEKGEAYAAAKQIEPGVLISARLAPDMYDLGGQVHWAAEGARLAGTRLVGTATSPQTAEPKSFPALYESIEATVRYLGLQEPNELQAGLERTIVVDHRGGSISLLGTQFFLQLALPGFFFHTTAAYAILRHQGVPLTKGDFMGALG
jgi:uncharacterized protein